MAERMFYAYIEVREWGEPDREQKIGPFSPEDPDATLNEQIDTLERNLAERGDMVNHIEVIEVEV